MNQSCVIIKSINHKITYVGPPPKPVYFAWINVIDSIILELWKIHSCLLKSRGAEDCLKTKVELKLFERKLDFWNLFEKFESRKLLENWSFRVYLKIGLLEIKCENENFRNYILKEIGILKMIWEFGIFKKNQLRKLGPWKLNFKRNQNWKSFEKQKLWKLNYKNWNLEDH